MSKICCIIGDPVSHSLSPLLHQAGYQAAAIEDDFRFLAIKVTREELSNFIETCKFFPLAGISVTFPHKTAVQELLAELSPEAKAIGAVNTLLPVKNGFRGDNTDWYGVVQPLVERTQLKNCKVLLIGAGGAARAAAYGLKKEGADVTIVNRTLEKAKKLANDFECQYSQLKDLVPQNFSVLINMTSVGMSPAVEQCPLPETFIQPEHIVFDAVYSPLETRLLKIARVRGASVVPGHEMLLYQGLKQFELYTNCKADVERMKAALFSEVSA